MADERALLMQEITETTKQPAKKYYWLKLKRDFFKRHDIRIIENQENGKDYVLFYLKMLVESIDHEGELRFNEAIPYDEKMLAVITNTNIDIVRAAMQMFVGLQMIELLDDKTIFMSEVTKLIGSETASAKRVRKHRAIHGKTPALLQCNADVTKCNTELESEKESESNKEMGTGTKAPKPIKHKHGEYNNVLLTDEQLQKLKNEFADWQQRIERLSEYMASTGKSYKDHLATIRAWARKEPPKSERAIKVLN